MYQSSFTGISLLPAHKAYNGGFCQFWYIPYEDVAVFPRVNAATQWLVDEPLLRPGKSWIGPVTVPRSQAGFTEELKSGKAGHWWATKIEGYHPGESAAGRILMENMPYHRYLVAGKLRAGGLYLLMGNEQSPLRFGSIYNGGASAIDTAHSLFTFTTEHRSKGYIMPQFAADGIAQADPGSGGGGTDPEPVMNNKEIIPFSGAGTVPIAWTPLRQARFGSFPIIQVWVQEGGGPPVKFNGGSIEADALPPAFTELLVRIGAPVEGFIEIM